METASSSQDEGSLTERRVAAAESVLALLVDLRHVVGRMTPDEWPAMATTVLEHHTPPIEDGLLSEDHRGLQQASRDTLAALAANDLVAAKAAIQQIRVHEERLGLELEDVRPLAN